MPFKSKAQADYLKIMTHTQTADIVSALSTARALIGGVNRNLKQHGVPENRDDHWEINCHYLAIHTELLELQHLLSSPPPVLSGPST